jgi:hypothetical protein
MLYISSTFCAFHGFVPLLVSLRDSCSAAWILSSLSVMCSINLLVMAVMDIMPATLTSQFACVTCPWPRACGPPALLSCAKSAPSAEFFRTSGLFPVLWAARAITRVHC